jgi:hypothetical protein
MLQETPRRGETVRQRPDATLRAAAAADAAVGERAAAQAASCAPAFRLSEDDVLRIAGCPNIDVGPSPGDRRRAVRVRVSKAVAILPTRDLARRSLRACLRDLSAVGIGLLYGGPVALGERFDLRLPRPGHGDVWVRCRATRCERLKGGLYLVGARFEGVANADGGGPCGSTGDSQRAMPPRPMLG